MLVLASSEVLKGIKSLESRLSNLEDHSPESFPRFYVWRSWKISSENHQPLIFNEIKYNDGEMYDAQSGKATAEYDGMYIFRLYKLMYILYCTNLYKSAVTGNVYFYIYINDEVYSKSGT